MTIEMAMAGASTFRPACRGTRSSSTTREGSRRRWSSSSDINYTGSGVSYAGATQDGGRSWSRFESHPQFLETGAIAVSRRDGRAQDHIVVLPGYSYAPHYSLDGGATWQRSESFPVGGDGLSLAAPYTGYWNLSLKQLPLVADPFVADTFYLKLTSGGFWRSTDAGIHWTQLDANGALPDGTHHGQLAANYNVEGDLWYAAGWEGASAQGLWHSTDAGVSWSQVAGPEYAITLALGAGRGAAGDAPFAVYFYGKLSGDATWGLFRSTDGGAAWERIANFPGGIIDRPTSTAADWDRFSVVYVGFQGTSLIYGTAS